MMKKSTFLPALLFLPAMLLLGGCGSQNPTSYPAPPGTPAAPAAPQSNQSQTNPATSPAAPTTSVPNGVQGSSSAVTIQNFSFSPASLTIKKGETVTWTNKDSAPHQIASDTAGKFQGPSISNGQTYSFTFNETGTFAYHCAIHSMMKATVTVQ